LSTTPSGKKRPAANSEEFAAATGAAALHRQPPDTAVNEDLLRGMQTHSSLGHVTTRYSQCPTERCPPAPCAGRKLLSCQSRPLPPPPGGSTRPASVCRKTAVALGVFLTETPVTIIGESVAFA
jgi:hypothetical protein